MFTGLVEDIGIIKAVQSDRDSMKITVQSAKITEDVKLGDSIAVNGVCLTVTNFTQQQTLRWMLCLKQSKQQIYTSLQ